MTALGKQPAGLFVGATNQRARKGEHYSLDEKDLLHVRYATSYNSRERLTIFTMIGTKPRSKMSAVQAHFPLLMVWVRRLANAVNVILQSVTRSCYAQDQLGHKTYLARIAVEGRE